MRVASEASIRAQATTFQSLSALGALHPSGLRDSHNVVLVEERHSACGPRVLRQFGAPTLPTVGARPRVGRSVFVQWPLSRQPARVAAHQSTLRRELRDVPLSLGLRLGLDMDISPALRDDLLAYLLCTSPDRARLIAELTARNPRIANLLMDLESDDEFEKGAARAPPLERPYALGASLAHREAPDRLFEGEEAVLHLMGWCGGPAWLWRNPDGGDTWSTRRGPDSALVGSIP